MEKYLAVVRRAIEGSIKELELTHPDEELAGYALITDDNLSTLGCMYVSHEYLMDSDWQVKFEPVDWPYAIGAQCFETASALLSELSAAVDSTKMKDYCEATFRGLAGLLLEFRSIGAFKENVFLSVISSDPSEFLERLEFTAVAEINSEPVVTEWRNWIEEINGL